MRRAQVWIPLLLVAATAAVYQDVRGHAFVDLDDLPYVVENPDLRVESPGEAVRVALRSTSQVNWTPLTVLSLQVDRALHGGAAPGYLLGNVVLHAASAVLLFLALARLTGDTGPSAFVAAVFALHPLHVESVAWAAQRKDSLSALFWMLTLLAYAGYAEQRSGLRYAGVALALCAALLAKPVAVTLPFVLLLLDGWPLDRLRTIREARRAVLEKLPLLAPVAAVAVVTLLLQEGVDAVAGTARLPLAMRVANALDASVFYLVKTVWPTDLAVFYPYSPAGLSAASVLTCVSLLGALSVGALAQVRRRPYLLVGWLWFLGTLVPTIGLVQVGSQARADRYTYLPMIGLAIAVAWAGRDLAAASPWRRALLVGAGTAACLALGVTAAVQVTHWRSAITLHRHAVAVTRDNLPEMLRLARAYRVAGRLEEATQVLEVAAATGPTRAVDQIDLGDLYARVGRLREAEGAYRRALELDPTSALAHANLGLALVRLERPRGAKWHLKEAIRHHASQAGALPSGIAPYLAMVEAHIALGEVDLALPYYAHAVSLDARRAARVAGSLAVALAETGRFEAAREILAAARAADPASRQLRSAERRVEDLRNHALR